MRKEYPDLRHNADSENINQNAFYSLLFVINNKFIIIVWLVSLFSENQNQMQKSIPCTDVQGITMLFPHPEKDANYSCRNLESWARAVKKSGDKR